MICGILLPKLLPNVDNNKLDAYNDIILCLIVGG